MGDAIHDHCGMGLAHTVHDTYSLGEGVQHRGREVVGMWAKGYRRLDVAYWLGEVGNFNVQTLQNKIFPTQTYNYHTFGVHVRYATQGRKDARSLLEDAHPQVIGGIPSNRGNHVLIRDCDALLMFNGQVNIDDKDDFFRKINPKVLEGGCDTECLLHLINHLGPEDVLIKLPGAYTAVYTEKNMPDVIVLRDRLAMRPASLGYKNNGHIMVSENSAFDKATTFVKELEPGCIHHFLPDGKYNPEFITHAQPKHCHFEWQYLLNEASTFARIPVRMIRENIGLELAEEYPLRDYDLVTFGPECPEIHARNYANQLGIDFFHVFLKMKNTRSFLGSTQIDRERSLDENLFLLDEIKGVPVKNVLRGKRVIVVEDSVIRGTVAKRLKKLLYEEAKVKEARILSCEPQYGLIGLDDGLPRYCGFGVDTPRGEKFIAITHPNNGEQQRNRTLEEIQKETGIRIDYLSPEGLFRAFEKAGMPRQNLCHFCIGGPHPFEQKPIVDLSKSLIPAHYPQP